MTRVLHIVLDLQAGGLERLVAEMVPRLDASRFESHVLSLGAPGRFAAGLSAKAKLHVLRPIGPWSMLWPRALRRAIRSIRPDVVHVHSGVWYKGSLAARLAGAPAVLYTEHGRQHPDPWPNRILDRLASHRTDVVVAVSDDLRRRLVSSRICNADRVVVVPNGVDTETFAPGVDDGRLRAELGIGRERPVIGSIGRFDRVKGYDVMIEAAALLRRDGCGLATPPVVLIAGEGPERASLERRIRERGLDETVRLLPWTDDVPSFHHCLSVFTLASRSEGTSMSLLEALSAAVCPVVTDVGGNRDVVGEQLNHRLVPTESPEALAEAWRKALGDPERARLDGRLGRVRVRERFSLDTTVARYAALYERRVARDAG